MKPRAGLWLGLGLAVLALAAAAASSPTTASGNPTGLSAAITLTPTSTPGTPTPTPTRTPTRTLPPSPTRPPLGSPQVLGFDVWCGRSDALEKVDLMTATFDPNGIADLKLVYFIINETPSYVNGVGLAYNLELHQMLLRNDANTDWIVGGPPGSAGQLDNSRATLYVSESSASDVDGNLVIRWKVAFKAPFAGEAYNLHVDAVDYAGHHSGWQTIGAWGVGTSGHPPCVGAINPPIGASYAGSPVTFTTQTGDPDGLPDLRMTYFLIGQAPTGSNAVYLAYDHDLDRIFLRNDANTAWLGGYAPGSLNVIENSRVAVDVAGCTVVGVNQTAFIHWSLRFKTAFAGWKYLYAAALDDEGHYAAFQRKGSWYVHLPKPEGADAFFLPIVFREMPF